MHEVIKWSSGGTPKATEKLYYENGSIPWLIIGDLNDGFVLKSEKLITDLGFRNSNAKMIPKGSLLVAMYGSIGKLGISGIDCCCNQAIAFAAEQHNLLTKYVFYYMQRIKADLIEKGKGGTQKNISLTVLNSIDIIVPPITDQQRIVERIEELFSELNKAEETLLKIKSQLEIYKQAVLKEAFEGKLEYKHRKQCNIKFKVALEKEIKDLPKLPEKWRYVYLRDLGDLARGKSKHRPRNDSRLFENGKYPFIQTGEVKAANNVITEYHKMYGEFGLAQSKLWPKGTLCITIAANIAETAFLGFDACFPDSIVGFTPNKMVNSHYIKYFIEASKIKLWAFAPATAQKNINLSTLENLIVPYCDIVEQEYIVGLIDSKLTIFRSIEDTIEESVVKISSLRQSILKEAFEGKLV